MTTRDFRLPDVGEGLTEAEVLRWLVAVGDRVQVNQPLLEIETAKAMVELPCPVDGVVTELLVEASRTVPVGTALVTFEVEGDDETAPAQHGAQEGSGALLVGYGVAAPTSRRRRLPVGVNSVSVTISSPSAAPGWGRARTKPPVRHLARRLGIDVHSLLGSGPNGVVTREDVHRAAGAVSNTTVATPATPVIDLPGDERIDLTGVGRVMADAMVVSVSTAPQATVWLDVDMTNALSVVAELRALPELAGVRLTPLTVVAWALSHVAMRHRGINASFDAAAGQIVLRHDVNLGIAVASPRGLVVPNIKAAQQLDLPAMAAALTELTETARAGRT